jgi:HAD superfamily hydrolase (TIGR01549 family)
MQFAPSARIFGNMGTFGSIKLEGIKGVLLDLDDTLYPYGLCHEFAMKTCESFIKNSGDVTAEQFVSSWKEARNIVHQDLHGQGASHSRLLYFHKQHEILFGKSNPEFALKMEKVYWDSFIGEMKLKQEAKLFLEELRSRGIKSCLVTDLTTQIQMQKWEHLKLGNYIDFLVSSEEAGEEKPSKKIFELALKKLGLSYAEVIMIGDHPVKDIEGAEKMGIKAYLIQN